MSTPAPKYVPESMPNQLVTTLPEGEYPFEVIEVEPLYESKKHNLVLPVKLQVGHQKVHVYDNPSAGLTKNGEPYDNIIKFLLSIGRPVKPGQPPDLSRLALVGKTGTCKLKVEVAQAGALIGKPINKVHYYIWETPDGSRAIVPTNQPETEPDDIPF